jgi:hypothetical protein
MVSIERGKHASRIQQVMVCVTAVGLRPDRQNHYGWRSRLFAWSAIATLVFLAVAPRAMAEPPAWGDIAAVETITAITRDEAGDIRETTIWLVGLDGAAFIRTAKSTAWGDDVERNPEIVLRVAGTEYPVRITFIEDEEIRDRVRNAFRDKYGFGDAAIALFRGRGPRIMQVDANP